MTKAKPSEDEQDANAFRAVFLNGEPLVPPTLTAPCDVIGMAMQRLRDLRSRAAAEANRSSWHGTMNPVGEA